MWRVILYRIFRHPPLTKSYKTHTHTDTHLYTILIIIIIISHQLGLDRPVSPSSNNHFEGLARCLRPFGLQFSIIFTIPLLFILVTCRSQLNLYLLSFFMTWFCSQFFQNLLIPSVVKMGASRLFFWNTSSQPISMFFILFSKGPNFAPLQKNGYNQCIIHICSLKNFV